MKPRLLAGADCGEPTSMSVHVARHGPLPALDAAALLDAVAASGLTGRGGAAFPVARKLAAVTGQDGTAVVVANGAEGEPAASKDATLLQVAPHLVLDGLQLAARAVGATTAVLYVTSSVSTAAREAVAQRAGDDQLPVEVVVAPQRFVAGEESAVASWLSGGAGWPRTKPPRVFESGVDGRPTLVQNVETLAHLALIARHGPAWFRSVGTSTEPGTMLFSVSGAVRDSRVVEAGIGVSLGQLVDAAGGATGPVQAVLLGGYHGAWLAAADAVSTPLATRDLSAHGVALGAGVVVVLPAGACGLAESSRVMDYLARESSGQCGPCLHGLPRAAGHFAQIAGAGAGSRSPRRLARDAQLLAGRGACHHPDGSVRFMRSALQVFQAEVQVHRRGRCTADQLAPLLPTPGC